MSQETHLSIEEIVALKETFRAQAVELLEDYGRNVLELEQSRQPGDLLKAIQRVVHTLKGDSMSLEFDQLAQLSHRLEDMLDSLRRRDRTMQRGEIDLLLECGDSMQVLLQSYCSEPPRPPMSIAPLLERLDSAIAQKDELSRGKLFQLTVTFTRQCQMHSAGALLIRQRLEPLARIHATNPDPDGAEIEQSRTWTLVIESSSHPDAIKKASRVPGVSSLARIEACAGVLPDGLPSDEEARGSGGETEAAAGSSAKSPASRASSASDQFRMDVAKIDQIMNLVGELVIGRSMVSQALSEISQSDEAAVTRLNAANNFLERTLSELQSVVLKIRMVPVDHVFRRFPRVVRDLAHSSGKHVELEIEGAATELDKSIVDALHEPLLHLVRNAIDHGLEPPEVRAKTGKPQTGVLKLAAFYEGNHVQISIEDDGKGIDLDEIRERAATLELATRQELDSLPREEVLNLIFQPGFSTQERVSTVSGRGIGMDVVRKAIEDLKGTIDVNTETERGTQFLIRLPLTLAILKAVLVESAGRVFAIPLSGVLEIVRLLAEEADSVLGKHVLKLRDRVVPLVDLKHALRLDCEPEGGASRAFVILVGEAERRVGLVVERVLGEHELVVKPIEDPLITSPGIAGASILGDGKVVLILNLRGLTERQRRAQKTMEALP